MYNLGSEGQKISNGIASTRRERSGQDDFCLESSRASCIASFCCLMGADRVLTPRSKLPTRGQSLARRLKCKSLGVVREHVRGRFETVGSSGTLEGRVSLASLWVTLRLTMGVSRAYVV